MPAAGEKPAGSRALTAHCHGWRRSSRVLGAQNSPRPRSLSLCQKYGSKGSVQDVLDQRSLPALVCAGFVLPLICWRRGRVVLGSQDGWLACVQPGIHHHPQVHVGRDPTQLLAPRALHWSLWKLFLLPTSPICLTSHRPARLAEPCCACWTSVPALPAGVIALAAHRDVFLEAVGLQHSGLRRRKSRHLGWGRHWGRWLLSRTVSRAWQLTWRRVPMPPAWSSLFPPLTQQWCDRGVVAPPAPSPQGFIRIYSPCLT